MKKLLTILILIGMIGISVSSCGTKHVCGRYSKQYGRP
jgi:hypothetical protein